MKELKDMLDFIMSMHMAADKAMLDDGKISWTEMTAFMPVVMKVIPAMSGSNLIIAEIKSMTPESKADLINWFGTNYDLENDVVEMAVEKGLELVLFMAEFGVKVFGDKK